MGTMLDALLHLQSIEYQLAQVRGRLETRKRAVTAQQRRIEQLKTDSSALHEKTITRRKDADRLELELRTREEHIAKSRAALNIAKTNKEYAAFLTQINTAKADNAKLEEEALKIIQEVDAIKLDMDKVQTQIAAEEKRLAEIDQSSAQEITRLEAMLADLTAQRAEAAKAVPSEALAVFERIADNYGGEAMAVIEIHGKRPPFEYICGGCFMSLNAEHANVLQVRDEVRRCDNCGRILYIDAQKQASPKQ